jgi:hypothetical protein
MNPSDRDDASVCEALTLPFVVLVNDRDVRTDEPDLGHFLAYWSRGGISRIRVETAQKRLDRVGPHPSAAECIDPHGIWGVDSAFSMSIVRALGFGSVLDHVKHSDAIRGTALT